MAIIGKAITLNISSATPSKPAPDPTKPVRLYDYDGTLLYSYTLPELQVLTELPTPPAHEGLIFEAWNWSLADLKTENAPMIVGANYHTVSGATEITVNLDDESLLDVDLVLGGYPGVNGSPTLSVDWGDGNVEDIYVNTGLVDYDYFRHVYTQTGTYILKLSPTTGSDINGGYNNDPFLLMPHDKNTITGSDTHYITAISKKIIDIKAGSHVCRNWGEAFKQSHITVLPMNYSWAQNGYGCVPLDEVNTLQFIVVPSGITALRSDIFWGCSALKYVSLPKSLTDIAYGAFVGCSNLQEIIIPEAVTRIWFDCFEKCYALQSIKLPSTLTKIYNRTFKDCYALQDVTIPNTVTEIEQNAFTGCRSLTIITIPNAVTTIGNSAFSECYGLRRMVIPNTITSFGNQVFANCFSMKLYDFTSWTISNLDNCTFGTNIFYYISTGTEIRFATKSIRDHAAAITNLVSYANYMTYAVDDTV